MEERSISYLEIALLQEQFNKQSANIKFSCQEIKDECFFDFVEQYIYGNDLPTVNYTE